MPTVKVDNNSVEIYYELHGEGPHKILFIVGFTESCRSWDRQIRFFKEYSDVFQICVFDNRGAGKSSIPNTFYSIRRMALDAWELLHHLRWHSVHVVGLSMGGMIAQELCLIDYEMSSNRNGDVSQNSPTLSSSHNSSNIDKNRNETSTPSDVMTTRGIVKSVVFAVTHAGGLSSWPPLATAWKLAIGWLWARSPLQEAQFFLPVLYSPHFLSLPFSEYLQRLEDQKRHHYGGHKNHSTELTPDAYRTVLDFLSAEWTKKGKINTVGCLHQLGAITRHYLTTAQLHAVGSHVAHILIVGASNDQMIRPENSRMLHRVWPHAEFVELSSGHMVHIECEVEFNTLVLNHFLRAIASSDSKADRCPTPLERSLLEIPSHQNLVSHSPCT